MRQFIKQVFASVVGTVVALSIFGVIGVTGLALLIITATADRGRQVLRDNSILVLDLSIPISDTESPVDISQLVTGEAAESITLRKVLQGIESAQVDDNVVALFLDGSQLSGGNPTGYAVLKEVRAALERFRESGKEIIAYDLDFSESEYYLASVANRVILNPMGSVEVNGLASEQIFFADALEQLGIGVQIIRVGQYKSAVEPLVQNEFSPENEAQLQAVLDDIWTDYLNTVAKIRPFTATELQEEVVDRQGFLLSPEAKTSGLIDEIAYLDEVIADFREMTGESGEENSFRQVSLSQYSNGYVRATTDIFTDEQIAVVYAEGSIVNGQGGITEIGADRFSQLLRELRQDDNVKAIVLRINSPGGSATASEVIAREVELITQEKPLVVSMGNTAASGGYWIATEATHIFAKANTITGSIGVFGVLPNAQELANNNGITWDVVKTGEFADSNTLSRPKTEQELAIYQNVVDGIYEQFISKVARSRQLAPERVAEIAQGRIWSGKKAQEIGLVDSIGGLDAAIAFAAKEAELTEDWQVTEYPYQPTLEEQVLKRIFGEGSSQNQDPLTREFLKLKEDLAMFKTFDDPRGIYVRLPLNLRID